MVKWGLKVFSYDKSPFQQLTAGQDNIVQLDWAYVGDDTATVGKTIGVIQVYHAGVDVDTITINDNEFILAYNSVGTIFTEVTLSATDYLTFSCIPNSNNFFIRFAGVFNNAIVHPTVILSNRVYKYDYTIDSVYNQAEYVYKNIGGDIVNYHLYYYTLPTNLLNSTILPISNYYGFFGDVHFFNVTHTAENTVSGITVSKNNAPNQVIPLEKFSSPSYDIGRRFSGFFPVLAGRLGRPSLGLVTIPYSGQLNPPLLPITVTVKGWLHKNQVIVKCHSPEMSSGSSFQIIPQRDNLLGAYVDLAEDLQYPEILYCSASFGDSDITKLKDLANIVVDSENINLLGAGESQALPYFTNIGTYRR